MRRKNSTRGLVIFKKPSLADPLRSPAASLGKTASLSLWALAALLPLSAIGIELFLVRGDLSLANFAVLVPDERQWRLLFHSFWVAGGAATLALLLGIPYAFLVSRCRIPGVGLFRFLGILPLLLPPLIAAIAWSGLFSIQGPWWAIVVFGLCYFPLVWILCARAFERVDRRMEEAARLAGGWKAAWVMELPFVLPSAIAGALLVFVFAIADFSVPDYLSTIGPKFSVYADDIFFRWKQVDATGEAVAASLPPLLFLAAALFVLIRLRRKQEASVGPGFASPEKLDCGAWRWVLALFPLLVLGLALGLPLGRLLWEAGGLNAYRDAFREARIDLGNSVLLAVVTALLATAIHTLPALFSARNRRSAGLDFAILLPLALPGVLLAIGFIRTWNRPGPWLDWSEWVYGTKLVVLLLFLARFSAFPYFGGSEAFRAIHPSLEEAAAVSGLPWGHRFRRILLPLAIPGLAAGAVFAYLFVMREIDAVALIPAGNRTIMFRIYNYIHFGRDSLIAALCLLSLAFASIPLLALHLWQGRRQEP